MLWGLFKQWDTVTHTLKPQCNIIQNQKELGQVKPEPLISSSLWRKGSFLPSSKEQTLYFQRSWGGLGTSGILSDILQVWWLKRPNRWLTGLRISYVEPFQSSFLTSQLAWKIKGAGEKLSIPISAELLLLSQVAFLPERKPAENECLKTEERKYLLRNCKHQQDKRSGGTNSQSGSDKVVQNKLFPSSC